MLVLNRKVGEQILLGDTICIKVISISDGRVRLGFAAPADVPILRQELVGSAHRAMGPDGSKGFGDMSRNRARLRGAVVA